MTRHELAFLARALSAPVLVAVLGAAAAYSGHHMADLPDLLARVGVMAVAAAPIAYVLFRPVARLLVPTSRAQAPVAPLHRLPRYAGMCMFGLTAITIASYVGHAHGSWQVIATAGPGLLVAMLLHVGLFSSYIGLFVYFLVLEHMVGLRGELWSRYNIIVPAGRGRIATRIVLGFAAVAAAPLLLVLADVQEGVPRTAAPMRQALQMDLFAAGLLTVMLVVVLTRAVARPVRALLEAMESVNRGDLATQAPVVSDDELGALSARFNKMVKALADRESVRRVFCRFVPQEVADVLIADEGAIAPQEREATVLYADIEGFTQIAAALSPGEILSMLNAHFDQVARIIHAHGGVITQFQGDAVLAGFNLPALLREHARHAVAAALEICARLKQQNSTPAVRMRIGVATGRVVGGTVGGGERLGYTLHGDTVNLAARLEELNKQLASRILIDARTAELLRGTVALRDRGSVAVRGFSQPLRLFEPIVAAAVEAAVSS